MENPNHTECVICDKAVCLATSCFSPACPDAPGRRCGSFDFCVPCAAEWENEEKALRAVLAVLEPAAAPGLSAGKGGGR